jgi:hypothetical protein
LKQKDWGRADAGGGPFPWFRGLAATIRGGARAGRMGAWRVKGTFGPGAWRVATVGLRIFSRKKTGPRRTTTAGPVRWFRGLAATTGGGALARRPGRVAGGGQFCKRDDA